MILATLEAEKRCGRHTRIMSEVHNGLFSKNLGTTTHSRMAWNDPEGALAGAMHVGDEDLSGENDKHMHKVLQHMDPGYAAGRILLTDYCDKLVSQACSDQSPNHILTARSGSRPRVTHTPTPIPSCRPSSTLEEI